MDDLARLVATVVFALVAMTSLFALGVRLVLLSRKGSEAAHMLGAAFMLLGLGTMRDPVPETVQAAKEHKQRKENDQGDPPDSDS
jgi:hypothetical protein